jgi:carnitine 3-dehydrogenase
VAEYCSAVYKTAVQKAPDTSKPLVLHQTRVPGDWLDYNGHMTEFRYLQVFGDATDAFLGHIGMDAAYRAEGRSVYTVETHIRHVSETKANTFLSVRTTVLGYDAKRIRLHHEMVDEEGHVQATGEHMLLHVDTQAGSASPMQSPLHERLSELSMGQSVIDRPDHAGASIREIGWPDC